MKTIANYLLTTIRAGFKSDQKRWISFDHYFSKGNSRALQGLTKGVSLRDQIRNSVIREELQTEDVIRWIRSRRRQWRDHVDRMDQKSKNHKIKDLMVVHIKDEVKVGHQNHRSESRNNRTPRRRRRKRPNAKKSQDFRNDDGREYLGSIVRFRQIWLCLEKFPGRRYEKEERQVSKLQISEQVVVRSNGLPICSRIV